MTNLYNSFYQAVRFGRYFLSLGLLLTVSGCAGNDNIQTANASSTIMTVPESVAQIAFLIDSAMAQDEDDEEDEDDEDTISLPPVKNPVYTRECGSCHFAYQPGLLPAYAWRKVMTTLQDHFDDNAELETTVQKTLTNYLVKNAADTTQSNLSARIIRSLLINKTPRRITEVPYIARVHRGLPRRMVSGNPEVESLSNCEHCHTRADRGSYSEEEIEVPGDEDWD